jgi:hypothetical protein
VKPFRGRHVHPPPEETFQVLLESNLIIQRGTILEVDQQVDVAPPGGFRTDHRAEDTRIPRSMLVKEYQHLTPSGPDNLGDPEAASRTDGAQSGDIPQARLASGTDLRIDPSRPPYVSTAEAAGETV